MEKAVTQVDIDYDEVLPVVQWGYPEDYHAKKAMCKANNATMISGHSSHHKKLQHHSQSYNIVKKEQCE